MIEKIIKSTKSFIAKNRYIKYEEAVKAILYSSMWDEYKIHALQCMKTNGNTKYYLSIINVCNSDMWNSDKLEFIENLSK